MEAILSLLSTYELFNNIFPGIIFSYILSLQNYNIIPNKIDVYEKLFLYYFIGLIISRIGWTAPIILDTRWEVQFFHE